MNTVLLHPEESVSLDFRIYPLRVFVDGVRRRDIEVLEWNFDSKYDWGSVMLTAGGFTYTTADSKLPTVGSYVEIRQYHDGGMCFRGYVVNHSLQLDRAGRPSVAIVENQLAAGLAQNITGRYVENALLVFLDEPLRFNVALNDLASSEIFEINGRNCRVFSVDDSGQSWSVGEALAYLLAVGLPADFSSTSREELLAMAGDIKLVGYDATKLSFKHAIADVARQGGLSVRVSRDGNGLVIFDESFLRRRTTIRLQQLQSDLDPSQSNVLAGEIKIKSRPAVKPIRMIGDYKRYESTFTLCPGWDESFNSQSWREFSQPTSSDWKKYRFVYRRWILNEIRENSNYDKFDFASLNSSDFISSRPRGFQPCLSRTDGLTNGVCIEYRLTSEDAWREWGGGFWLSDENCSAILADEMLSPDFLAAAFAQTLELRITASVEADKRLIIEQPGDPLSQWEIHDYSGSATMWLVHPTSRFYEGTGSEPQLVRDDTNTLTTAAQKFNIASSSATLAEVTLAWVDMSYHIGDEITAIEGADIDLISHSLGTPAIKSVRHEFGDVQKTHLVIEG